MPCMTTPGRFNGYNKENFDPIQMIRDAQKQRNAREREFSKDIGGRALKLLRSFGVGSKAYGWKSHDTYDFLRTEVTSNEKTFDSGECARISVTRFITSGFLAAPVMDKIRRISSAGIGTIDRVKIELIKADETQISRCLTRHIYGESFPVESQGMVSQSNILQTARDNFLTELEALEHLEFPR